MSNFTMIPGLGEMLLVHEIYIADKGLNDDSIWEACHRFASFLNRVELDEIRLLDSVRFVSYAVPGMEGLPGGAYFKPVDEDDAWAYVFIYDGTAYVGTSLGEIHDKLRELGGDHLANRTRITLAHNTAGDFN